MSSALAPAARVGDPISHSPMMGLALGGIGVGLVVGAGVVVLTAATGGADIPVAMAVAGAVSTLCSSMGYGFLAGKLAGWAADRWDALSSVTGEITSGAATVTIGPGGRAAARYLDTVACKEPLATYMGASVLGGLLVPGVGGLAAAALVAKNGEHEGATLAQGSATVLTEGRSQSRKGDKTTCGGKVASGCETVWIGGAPSAEVAWDAEVAEEVETAMTAVHWIGEAAGFISQKSTAKRVLQVVRVVATEAVKRAIASPIVKQAGHDLVERVKRHV